MHECHTYGAVSHTGIVGPHRIERQRCQREPEMACTAAGRRGEHITLAPTVDRHLGKRPSAQRFPVFADKDEVPGSSPGRFTSEALLSGRLLLLWTTWDHLARRRPRQLPFWRRLSGRLEVHTAAGHPGWIACYKIVRPYPSAAAAGGVSAGRGPGQFIGRVHQTGPGLASQAQRRRRRNARTARSTQPTSTTVTKTNPDRFQRWHRAILDQVVVTGRDLGRAARRWWPAPIDLEASEGTCQRPA